MEGTEWVAPAITGGLLVMAALVTGLATVRNGRIGATQRRAPSVTEAWAEADRSRNRAYLFEQLFYDCRGALRHLIRLVREQHPDYTFTPDVVEAAMLEAPPEAEEKANS